MIRNYQKSSSSSTVDLSPIYSSLQTINAFLYQLDVQTTIPQALNSLSNSINELSEAYNSLEQKISTFSNSGGMNFITDTLLTTYLTDYNTYYNSNFEIFEPYVQSITNYNYISAAYPNQRFNLPNATLNDTNANQVMLTKYTLDKIDGGFYALTDCVVDVVTNFYGVIANCTIDQLVGDTLMMMGGKVVRLVCNALGDFSIATIYVFSGSNCTFDGCIIDGASASSCLFEKCTMLNIPWNSNSYRSMTLSENRLHFCGLTDCVIQNEQTTGYYSECTLSNVSFPYLNSTQFYKCTGTIFIPQRVRNSIMFDVIGNYLYGENDYIKTYTVSSSYTNTDYATSTYTDLTQYTSTLTTNYYVTTDYTSEISDTVISRVTTDTIISDQAGLPQYPTTTTIDLTVTLFQTLTSSSIATTIYTFNEGGLTTSYTAQWQTTRTYLHYYDSTLTNSSQYIATETLTRTLTNSETSPPQLVVSMLPGNNYELPPNELIISTSYQDVFLDFNFLRNSTNCISIYNCSGNIGLTVGTANTFALEYNDFNNINIDISNFSASSIDYNIFTNCTINFYINNANDRAIVGNTISNLVFNHYAHQYGIEFSDNSINKGKFLAFEEDITFTHIYCTYSSATFEGSNEVTECTVYNITNEGTINLRDCFINTCLINNLATIRGCTIQKLIIKPDVPYEYMIEANQIETLIMPENMTDIDVNNTVGETVTY